MDKMALWNRYKKYLCVNRNTGLTIDISRMGFEDDYFDKTAGLANRMYRDMDLVEAGGIANPDEKRMVGHYWLRNPSLAPDPGITEAIENTVTSIRDFAKKIHAGKILSQSGGPFTRILVIGIGGSALGPRFVASALATPDDPVLPFFFDNTDPDGMDHVIGRIGDGLSETLTIVISKSGGTTETRNGMIEAKAAYEKAGLPFEKHAVAITGEGSALDNTARGNNWLKRFPMWDWVGGRTSELSAVGLLPAALQGIDIDSLLEGAKLCDAATRNKMTRSNPAALTALMWYYATGGQGSRDMVILPYKDRLEFLPRYLQQLVMESLGKEKDLDGNVVNQGITVYGNKGTTDQHAYVQQLRDGVDNFFVTFVEVLRDRQGPSIDVEKGVTTGDFLSSFLHGTRDALHENGRESFTITVDEINAFTVGALIALYERAVGFYASLINVNAYHQPGVEAGKKAAGEFVELQSRVLEYLGKNRTGAFTAEEIASSIGAANDAEAVFRILLHVSHNPDHGVERTQKDGDPVTLSRFRRTG